jgi:transcriptional regulator with XRE-family HTH domain
MGDPTGDVALGRRLRELRERHWPGVHLTQAQLARALSIGRPVSAPAISSWESQTKIPPASRIEAYARFFATRRSIAEGLVLFADADLTVDERRLRMALLDELAELRAAALGDGRVPEPDPLEQAPADDFWRFPDRRPVTIVCGMLPPDLRVRMPYADPTDPDYVEAYTYADVDALMELYGHLRAVNPINNNVRILRADRLSRDDYTTHLVLLGGVDVNAATEDVLHRLDLPVSQLAREDEGAIGGFEVSRDVGPLTLSPRLSDSRRGRVLLEDVAHFFRAPNPFNTRRTVTICNGMFGRGTYGAVRALTDQRFRKRNEDFVTARFDPDSGFSILMRVQIVNGEVLTPDWTLAETRLHEWPEDAMDNGPADAPDVAP